MADNITDVSDNNFQAEVLENDVPVLVDFWAPWCGPCRVVAPALEEIAEARDDLRIVKLNVDDNQQTAAQYQVLAIPTMILFRNGQEAKRIQGAMPKKRIEAELEPALAGGVTPPGRFPAVSEPLVDPSLWRAPRGARRRAPRGAAARAPGAARVRVPGAAPGAPGPPRRADRGAVGARGRAAERHRAGARPLAPAPRRRAGDARGPRHAAARLPRAGVGRRRGDLGLPGRRSRGPGRQRRAGRRDPRGARAAARPRRRRG